MRGDLQNQIAKLEANMPRAGSEGYIKPTKPEQWALSDMVFALEAGQLDSAIDQDIVVNYELFQYTDHGDDDAISYLLREQSPVQKGWGLYVFRAEPRNSVVIEAPHPLADERTPGVALDIYRALNARALLIAGAHRDANKFGSADSAHASESVFQSVHLALLQITQNSTEDAVFLQIHGFAADKHPKYPPVILGYSWEDDPEKNALLESIADAIRQRGIEVGVCHGKAYKNLCGRNNIQASVMKHDIFIHVELNESIRGDDGALVAALIQVFGE